MMYYINSIKLTSLEYDIIKVQIKRHGQFMQTRSWIYMDNLQSKFLLH